MAQLKPERPFGLGLPLGEQTEFGLSNAFGQTANVGISGVPGGAIPPGSFTYRRPGGVDIYIRPTDPSDTYLRP